MWFLCHGAVYGRVGDACGQGCARSAVSHDLRSLGCGVLRLLARSPRGRVQVVGLRWFAVQRCLSWRGAVGVCVAFAVSSGLSALRVLARACWVWLPVLHGSGV